MRHDSASFSCFVTTVFCGVQDGNLIVPAYMDASTHGRSLGGQLDPSMGLDSSGDPHLQQSLQQEEEDQYDGAIEQGQDDPEQGTAPSWTRPRKFLRESWWYGVASCDLLAGR